MLGLNCPSLTIQMESPMKLSEKGLKRILSEAHYSPEVEVKQEDFVGGVVLSIEEAEEIKSMIDVTADDWLMYSFLDELIEEAKGKNK